MIVVRPVRSHDIESILKLAEAAEPGMTSLPMDRDYLSRRIQQSIYSMQHFVDIPRGESYLFAMENTQTGEVVGVSGIVSKVGGFDPFYAYRIETKLHESMMLGVRKEVQVLHLYTEHNGPSEIGTLFLHPAHRRSGNGRLLSLSRFLYLAENPIRFEPMIIAEMRGVITDTGVCHFWEAIGRHFFDRDFRTADHLSIINKKFIAELMPTHPIYIPLLPDSTRTVIGKVHPNTEPALALLKSEGFSYTHMIDIFDGGPIYSCGLHQIRTVRDSRRLPVVDVVAEPMPPGETLLGLLCSSGGGHEFRATKAQVDVHVEGGIRIDQLTASALGVKPGDKVRVVPLFPPQNGTAEKPK